MEAAMVVYSVFARLLAVASAVLGFMAEGKKLTPSDIYYSQGKCVYPVSAAFTLGICAVSLLGVAQIIVSLVGCCSGNGGSSGSRRIWGNVCYALSWVAAVIAVGLYVQGVVWNAATTRDPEPGGLWFVRCRYLQGAAFTRAALLSLAATALGISSSYIMLCAQAPAVATTSPAAPAAAPPASGAPGTKPDAAGEAIAVPVELPVHSASNQQGSRPSRFHPYVEGYGQASNQQGSRPPQRRAQPAYEVMMA